MCNKNKVRCKDCCGEIDDCICQFNNDSYVFEKDFCENDECKGCPGGGGCCQADFRKKKSLKVIKNKV